MIYDLLQALGMGFLFTHTFEPKEGQNSYICPEYYMSRALATISHVLLSAVLHSHVVLQWQRRCRLIKVRPLSKISRHGYLARLILFYRLSDFICSLAGTWAEETLAGQVLELEPRDGKINPHYICTAKNENEECTMSAGRRRGIEATQAFEKDWANAQSKP
jgi:hypothetical protein